LSAGVRLEDLCAVCRSKNAGPFLITLDMIFKDPAAYRVVADRRLITEDLVAERYRIPSEDVVAIEYIDGLNAVKASYKRRLPAGSPGDPDCFGMNQEAPLLDISFPADLFPPPAARGQAGGEDR
jgi:uncharacterized protein DUF4387